MRNLQAQVEATEKLLSAEQAAGKQLRAEGEALAKELGGVKSALADAVRELDAERGGREELAAQLEEVKQQYHSAGGVGVGVGVKNRGSVHVVLRCPHIQLV